MRKYFLDESSTTPLYAFAAIIDEEDLISIETELTSQLKQMYGLTHVDIDDPLIVGCGTVIITIELADDQKSLIDFSKLPAYAEFVAAKSFVFNSHEKYTSDSEFQSHLNSQITEFVDTFFIMTNEYTPGKEGD